MKTFFYYFKYWWLMSRNAFAGVLTQKLTFLIFLFGKVVRFTFFTLFLIFLLRDTNTLAGYSLNQTLFFFLTFNLIDVVSQFLFREVYRFRPQVVSGSFDLTLSKPTSALFRSLMGGADVIDFATIPPLLIAVYLVGRYLEPTYMDIIVYIILILNGLLVAAAFHIAVLALGIITLEVDYVIWMYRDLMNLGKLPVDVYKQPLRGILTFLVPVALMVTVPAKVAMGLFTLPNIAISLAGGMLIFYLSLRFWKFALRYYTSASS